MEHLINNLLLADMLNDGQIALVRRNIRTVRLKKGDYYIEPGAIVSQLLFVERGVMRFHYYDRHAENITSRLVGEGHYLAPSCPLPVRTIRSDYLQAVTDSELSVICSKSMVQLSALIQNWDRIVCKVAHKVVREARSRTIMRATDKDAEAVAASYLQRFHELASYLTLEEIIPYFTTHITDNGNG